MEYTYVAQNKDNIERGIELSKRLSELKTEMERLDEKYYIKEEMNKEKYDRMIVKLMQEEKEIYDYIEDCLVSISNLNEREYHYCRRACLKSLVIVEKQILQKLVYPEGLLYDKKKQAFQTKKINEAIFQIACFSSDLEEMKKGLSSLYVPIKTQRAIKLLAVCFGVLPKPEGLICEQH